MLMKYIDDKNLNLRHVHNYKFSQKKIGDELLIGGIFYADFTTIEKLSDISPLNFLAKNFHKHSNRWKTPHFLHFLLITLLAL